MNPVMTLAQTDVVAYGLTCKFLGKAFRKPPQPELWQVLVSEQLFASWPLPAEDPFTQVGLDLLVALTAEPAPTGAVLPALRDDYAALFVGPAKLKAPPWESVYLSRDHILFEKQTRQVRAFYAAYGLQFNHIHVEPDDHFGLELLFLAHLFGTAIERIERGDYAGQTQVMAGVSQFLQTHLLQWAEPFLARVVYHAATDYYRGLAYLSGGLLSSLCTKLAVPWELEL